MKINLINVVPNLQNITKTQRETISYWTVGTDITLWGK